MLDVLLKDENGKQIVLSQNSLTKKIAITVIDRATQKRRVYKNKRLVTKLFADCIKE